MCKVSIIIPCYNVDFKLFYRCLESIDSQTFSEYEVIVVNDGSDSDYDKIFAEIKNKYKNIAIYHQENKGVSAARNFKMKKSQGEFIVYVDADDYLSPVFLEEAIGTAETYNADIVIGMNITTKTTENEQIKKNNIKEVSVYENIEIKDLYRWMLGRVQYHEDGSYLGQGPWNRFVKRELAISTLFNEKLPIGEDIVWNLQLLQKARKVCIVNCVWYIYYMNPSSSSRQYRENAIKESHDSLMEMKKYLDLKDDEQYISYCLRCWSDLKRIYYYYLSYNKKVHTQEKKYLLNNEPWYALASQRFKKICNFKFQFMRILYISHLVFNYYCIKAMLLRKRHRKMV